MIVGLYAIYCPVSGVGIDERHVTVLSLALNCLMCCKECHIKHVRPLLIFNPVPFPWVSPPPFHYITISSTSLPQQSPSLRNSKPFSPATMATFFVPSQRNAASNPPKVLWANLLRNLISTKSHSARVVRARIIYQDLVSGLLALETFETSQVVRLYLYWCSRSSTYGTRQWPLCWIVVNSKSSRLSRKP